MATGATPSTGSVLEVLHAAADSARAALGASDEWGASGLRRGQYVSDLTADRAVLDVLHEAGLPTLSEESGLTGDREPGGPVVVVDPLDGSTNASRGLSWWATSLCVVDGSGPLAALVVDLRHGTRWEATRGGGATRDGEPIRATGCSVLGDAIVGLNGVPAGHGGWAQYRALGACALDMCAVADGTLDGFLDCTVDELGVWDYLGATLVCSEAGATVADAADRDLVVLDHSARRIPVAGASAALFEELRDLHPEHGKGRRA